MIFDTHIPWEHTPLFESWDRGIDATYPWVPTTTHTTRATTRLRALELATEGLGWGPMSAYVTLDEGVPGSPLPMPLPRWLISHTQRGLLRTPYLAYTELRFELVFGRRYRLRFCTEWPFGDQLYAHIGRTRYKKVGYDFLIIDLEDEWAKLRIYYGLPDWTPHPIIDQITVRAYVSGSPIGYDAIFRQAFLALLDILPPDWPWRSLL